MLRGSRENLSQPHNKQELKTWRDSEQRELSHFRTLQLPTPAVQLPPLLPQVGTHADGMG